MSVTETRSFVKALAREERLYTRLIEGANKARNPMEMLQEIQSAGVSDVSV